MLVSMQKDMCIWKIKELLMNQKGKTLSPSRTDPSNILLS